MWDKLNQREKLLLILTLFILILLGLTLLIQSLSKKREETRQNLEKARQDLQTLIRLKNQIQSIPGIDDVPGKNELLTLITGKLEEMQLSPNSIRDREETVGKSGAKVVFVDMSFNGISLHKLWKFLYEIEYSRRGIRIKELVIRKPLPGRDIFDVRLTVFVEQAK